MLPDDVHTEVQYEEHRVTLSVTRSPAVLAEGIPVQPTRFHLDYSTTGSDIVLEARRPDGQLYGYSSKAVDGWPDWVLALAEKHRPTDGTTRDSSPESAEARRQAARNAVRTKVGALVPGQLGLNLADEIADAALDAAWK